MSMINSAQLAMNSVFKYLSGEDLSNCSLVCKDWKKYVDDYMSSFCKTFSKKLKDPSCSILNIRLYGILEKYTFARLNAPIDPTITERLKERITSTHSEEIRKEKLRLFNVFEQSLEKRFKRRDTNDNSKIKDATYDLCCDFKAIEWKKLLPNTAQIDARKTFQNLILSVNDCVKRIKKMIDLAKANPQNNYLYSIVFPFNPQCSFSFFIKSIHEKNPSFIQSVNLVTQKFASIAKEIFFVERVQIVHYTDKLKSLHWWGNIPSEWYTPIYSSYLDNLIKGKESVTEPNTVAADVNMTDDEPIELNDKRRKNNLSNLQL